MIIRTGWQKLILWPYHIQAHSSSIIRSYPVAYLAWSSGSWSTPPQLGHNRKTSISVTNVVTHNQKLVATTNSKLTALWNSLSKQLFLIVRRPKTAFFVSQLPSRTSWLVCVVADWGRGCMCTSCTIDLAPPFLKFWIRHCYLSSTNLYPCWRPFQWKNQVHTAFLAGVTNWWNMCW